jgi:Uma2 family endonuclease
MELADPHPLSWTVDDYIHLCEEEWFAGRRVQLVGGRIYEWPPSNNFETASIHRGRDELERVFGPDCWVRIRGSLALGPASMPDPDLAVVAGAPHTHPPRGYPCTALLVVEVADITLDFDRTTKASVYAAGGIADYWVVNLVDRRLEVFRQPSAAGYASHTALAPGDRVAPLAAPEGATIDVGAILP